MKNLLLLFAFLNACFFVSGQGLLESWKVSMREQYGMVKNTERFETVHGEEVLYFAERGEQKFLFTQNGVIVRQPEESSPQEKYERHKRREEGLPVSMPHFSTFTLRWNNHSSETNIELQEPYSFSYNYQSIYNSSKTIKETLSSLMLLLKTSFSKPCGVEKITRACSNCSARFFGLIVPVKNAKSSASISRTF